MCELGCPWGMHEDEFGFCVKGCPEGYSVNERGKCEYDTQSSEISMRYIVIFAVGALIVTIVCLYFLRAKFKREDLTPIEDHLAVVLAKIHNSTVAKNDSEMVSIGIGTNPKVIKEWVEVVWYLYVMDVEYD